MCDSEYDERGLPIGAYDNIKTSNNKGARAQSTTSTASGNAVWEKVVTNETFENETHMCPEYVTPDDAT